MKQPLFNDDGTYTSEANSLDHKAFKALEELFKEACQKHNRREVAHLLSLTIFDLELRRMAETVQSKPEFTLENVVPLKEAITHRMQVSGTDPLADKIGAIKQVRALTDCGLKEAKHWCEINFGWSLV